MDDIELHSYENIPRLFFEMFPFSVLDSKFSRVLLRIDSLWEQSSACINYMAALLIQEDGITRQGFPLRAVTEIVELISMCERFHNIERSPIKDIWSYSSN